MSSISEKLREFRKQGIRNSIETYELCSKIYNTRHENNLREERWAFFEQYTIACIDVGDYDKAEELLIRLANKFPKSPRVSILEGMLLESKGEFKLAEGLYNSLLEEDKTNVAVHKRLIVLSKLMNPRNPSIAIEKLNKYLDTFYSDPEAWMELADMYTQQQNYQRALFAIEECMLLQPINPFYILKYAETQYTTGDITQSYKSYLRLVELQSTWPRAWLGLKMCCKKLFKYPRNEQPRQLERIDELTTKKVLELYSTSYSSKPDQETRNQVLKFVE